MKILIYAHAFAPRVGGAETYVLHLANGLSCGSRDAVPNAAQVTVATPTPAAGFDDRALSFRVVRRPGARSLFSLVRWADVVLLAGPVFLPLALALIQRKPVIVEHHGYQAVCPNGLLLREPSKERCPGHFMARRYHRCVACERAAHGWWRGVLKVLVNFPRRWMCRKAAANIAISRHVAERLQLPQTTVVYHGIPLPAAVDAAFPQSPPVFAYVGRLVSEKGLPLLLHAAKRLVGDGYRLRVKFVGDGPERRRLEGLAAALGITGITTITGFLRGSALDEALRDVIAVVMPSVGEETAGLAAIENMARGRLVIAADVGGLGEIVDGTGLKFAPGDAAALAACMRRALDEPDLVARLGRAGRERALRMFNVGRMVREHADLLQKVVTEVSRRG